jgi:hypothetical protein
MKIKRIRVEVTPFQGNVSGAAWHELIVEVWVGDRHVVHRENVHEDDFQTRFSQMLDRAADEIRAEFSEVSSESHS